MTDAEVAEFFGISKRTFQGRVAKPVLGEINPNDAKPQWIGGRRFWLRRNVERLAGMESTGKETENKPISRAGARGRAAVANGT